jgi:hypothetical protein
MKRALLKMFPGNASDNETKEVEVLDRCDACGNVKIKDQYGRTRWVGPAYIAPLPQETESLKGANTK